MQSPARPDGKELGQTVEIAFDAKVFRGDARSGYPYIQPYCVNFIAQCVTGRSLKKDGTVAPYTAKESDDVQARLDLLLMAADHLHAKYLVLGALGCGAFHHPVRIYPQINHAFNALHHTS